MLFLLYRHTDDGVIGDFPKISVHFPKISEDSPKFVQRSHERCRAFSKYFRRLPTIAGDFRGRHEDVDVVSYEISSKTLVSI